MMRWLIRLGMFAILIAPIYRCKEKGESAGGRWSIALLGLMENKIKGEKIEVEESRCYEWQERRRGRGRNVI